MSNPMSEILRRMLGKDSVLIIHKPILELCDNDYAVALFIEQCVYWDSRMKGGWFYKQDDDWRKELGLSDYKMRAIKKMIKDGSLPFIDHEIRKANGAPTSHYRVNISRLVEAIEADMYENEPDIVYENVQNEGVENIQIINRDYTETTHICETTPKEARNALFSAIALHVFDLTEIPRETAPRIGKIVSHVRRLYPTHGADEVKAFAGWWKMHYPTANIPRDATKFGEHYAAFAQEMSRRYVPVVTVAEEQDEGGADYEERKAALARRLKGG